MIPCPMFDVESRDKYVFGLGEGNRYGYVSVVLWPSARIGDSPDRAIMYSTLRRSLAERVQVLVEQDPECQSMLAKEAQLRGDV